MREPEPAQNQEQVKRWIALADCIAQGKVLRKKPPEEPDHDEVPVNNYGMLGRHTLDPGKRNEVDPDRFTVSSSTSALGAIFSLI